MMDALWFEEGLLCCLRVTVQMAVFVDLPTHQPCRTELDGMV